MWMWICDDHTDIISFGQSHANIQPAEIGDSEAGVDLDRSQNHTGIHV